MAGAHGCAVHSCVIAVPAFQIDLLLCILTTRTQNVSLIFDICASHDLEGSCIGLLAINWTYP